MKKLGLYIHIPFCARKCNYCDFYSLPYGQNLEKLYVEALCNHINQEKGLYLEYELDTIYVGGGTPSILSGESVERISTTIKNSFNISEKVEFTVELNPCSVTKEKLLAYKRLGVNRLSIGMQSAHNSELKCLGRLHTREEMEKAYFLVRECGFDNISLDVMFALPGQTLKKLQETLNYACSLIPEHISAYGLKIEENTPFGRNKDSLVLPSEDEEWEMYQALCDTMEANGYEQYEISNFSKKGFHSRHNIKYWMQEDYVGFGPSSHSCVNGVRYYYESDIFSYISENHTKIIEEDKENTICDKMDEYVMLRLRLCDGIDETEFEGIFGKSFTLEYPRALDFVKTGHASYKNGKYKLTREGFFVSNFILATILH